MVLLLISEFDREALVAVPIVTTTVTVAAEMMLVPVLSGMVVVVAVIMCVTVAATGVAAMVMIRRLWKIDLT